MRWRPVVGALALLALLDAVMIPVAYSASTWNLHHTEVLYRWDAVREVCLVFFPIFMTGIAVFCAVAWAIISWAMGGHE